MSEEWLRGQAISQKKFNSQFKPESAKEFCEYVEMGLEFQFKLNGTIWLVEPDKDAPDFSEKRSLWNMTDLTRYDFEDGSALMDFQIDGVPLKD